MDMIVLADSDGVVDMTQEAIARITNVPLERVKAAIVKLEAPDSRSRTPDHEGCRLIRLDDHRDWGWIIVNYAKFRGTSTDDKRRELTKLRVRKLRLRQQVKNHPQNCNCDSCNALHNVTVRYPPSPSSSVHQGNGVQGEGVVQSFEQAYSSTVNAGIDREFCHYVYQDWSSRDGKDASNCTVDFLRYVIKRWNREGASWRNGSHRGKPGSTQGIPISMQIKATEKAIAEHPANRNSVFHDPKATDLQAANLRGLQNKLKILYSQCVPQTQST